MTNKTLGQVSSISFVIKTLEAQNWTKWQNKNQTNAKSIGVSLYILKRKHEKEPPPSKILKDLSFVISVLVMFSKHRLVLFLHFKDPHSYLVLKIMK